MAVDYDLVVIGRTMAGVWAAIAAARLRARVALVDFPAHHPQPLDATAKYTQGLSQIAQKMRAWEQIQPWELNRDRSSISLPEAMEWTQAAISNLAEPYRPEVLAGLGIDTITVESAAGEFRRTPQLSFAVNSRLLTAARYLLAMGSSTHIPDISGLQETGYLTIDTLDQLQTIPEQLVMIGGEPVGVELAQVFARLGSSVTLVLRSPQILPKEDPEAARLIQAQLEADGVRILSQTEAIQTKRIEGKKWIQAGHRALEADEIILATGQQPKGEGLNLEAVGVKWNRHCIQTNQKLQTTQPKIYACGDAIGGYRFPHLALYEAKVALKNALFLPIFNVDYRWTPWAIYTSPPLARVGLTEAQARRRYGKDVMTVRQDFKSLNAAVLQGEMMGFCKAIALETGEVLGASVVGAGATEIIGAIALSMQHKIKIQDWCKTGFVFASFSEVLAQVSEAWNQQQLDQNEPLQDLLAGVFEWRRSWFK